MTYRFSPSTRSINLVDNDTSRLGPRLAIHRQRSRLERIPDAIRDDFGIPIVGSVHFENLIAGLSSENVGERRFAESWRSTEE